MFVDPWGLASIPVIENGTIVDYRLPLRDIVSTLGGTIKLNEDSVTIDVLGKNITIPYDSPNNIDGTLYFTVKETLDLLGIKYDMEQISINVSTTAQNTSTVAYVAKYVINNQLISNMQGVINNVVSELGHIASAVASVANIGFDVATAINIAGGNSAKVLPSGNYTRIVFRVETPKTGQKSGIISLTFGANNDYVMLKREHWSAEFNSNRIGNGYQIPGYTNIYSH